MKNSILVGALLLSSLIGLHADQASTTAGQSAEDPALPASTEYRVVDHDANQRVWQRETYEKASDGSIVTHVHQYTELASGMYYQDTNGQWAESQELIESYPSGAVARQGQYQVIFANNLNSAGSIDMQTPDGKRLRSNILGLMYVDTSTGDAIIIADVQDSAGVLISSNQVLYPNAFDGVKADVQYTYKRGSFEQDVILREQPPSPESLGLNSATTELEVFTEFLDAPAADVQEESTSEQGLETDENINWGVVNLGHGKAFNLGNGGSPAPVAKRYMTIQGRQFLLEKVRVKDVQAEISKLPEQAANARRLPMMALKDLSFPKTPLTRQDSAPMRLASVSRPNQGYVLDYVTLNATFTNYTFRADTTYYISGTATIDGGTFEGGTVIKYAQASTGINFFGGVNCNTSPYRPAIFTAADDDSVGEKISGSSGSPSGMYASTYLVVYCPTCYVDLEYLRISYAADGIELYNSTDNYIRNCQFYGNGTALYLLQNASIENCLFQKSPPISGGSSATASLVNCTVHNVSQLNSVLTLSVTNSLLIGVTNLGPAFTSVANYTNINDAGIFQVAGAGNHYLPTTSPYLDMGVTNISSTLLSNLKRKTTGAPTVLSNVTYTASTLLSPQVQRDTNIPDLGYHYDPLDYLTYNCAVTNNAVLTITNGTAIANYNTNGIWLQDGSSLVSIGTPLSPNWLVRYQSVQEQPVLLGGSSLSAGVPVGAYHFNNSAPSAAYRFTKFTCPANGGCDLYNISFPYNFTNLVVQDCEFWSGANYVGGDTNSTIALKNNLFWRAPFVATSPASNSLSLSNNLFVLISSKIQITQPTGSVWYAFNNMFDTCWIDSAARCTNGYNAYFTSTNRITPVSASDIVLSTAFSYYSGALGNYYYSTVFTPPYNRGSTTADVAGLYHYTTQFNQKKETNSVVDIGYHYVALDTNGLPFDSNGDGIPDYLEDSNGNGVYDAGDVNNWTNDDTDSNGLPDWWEIANFGHTGIDPNDDPDGDQLSTYQEFLMNSQSYSPVNWNSSTNSIVGDGFLDFSGDGLANLMEASFGGNLMTNNVTWKANTSGDGLPDEYKTLVGLSPSSAQPAPELPSYSKNPIQ